MGREPLDAVRRASSDDTVRAVLVTGAGRAFCAGAAVKNARDLTPEGHPDLSIRLRETYNPIAPPDADGARARASTFRPSSYPC